MRIATAIFFVRTTRKYTLKAENNCTFSSHFFLSVRILYGSRRSASRIHVRAITIIKPSGIGGLLSKGYTSESSRVISVEKEEGQTKLSPHCRRFLTFTCGAREVRARRCRKDKSLANENFQFPSRRSDLDSPLLLPFPSPPPSPSMILQY